ncbi:3883_t:CDS:2, partial [Acaulospora morrowiae]
DYGIMSSLIKMNTLPSSSTLSSFPLENTEVHAIDDEEYVPLLTFHQRSLENLKSDLEDEKEDTTSVYRVTINNYFEKLEPLLSKIHDVSKQLYTPSSNVSVNEMMFQNLITLRIRIYIYFLANIAHLSKWCTKNNYFSNVPLFQNLRQLGIGACGTVCKTASGFPKELRIEKNVKLDWDIRSDIIVNGVLLVFWQDNGPVTMLSTIHGLVDEEWEIKHERRQLRETSINVAKD